MSDQARNAMVRVGGVSRELLELSDALPKLVELSGCFAVSRLFGKDLTAEQAFVKLLTGSELGLTPAQSMREVHVVEGKPVCSSNLYALKLRTSGRYDYSVVEHSRQAVELEFFATLGKGIDRKKEWVSLGRKRIELAEADAAGWTKNRSGEPKETWKRYPEAMLFARVISAGAKLYCPDALQGGAWYTPDELGLDVDEEGRPVKVIQPVSVTKARRKKAGETIDVPADKGPPACPPHLPQDGPEGGEVCGRCGEVLRGPEPVDIHMASVSVAETQTPPPAAAAPPAPPAGGGGPAACRHTSVTPRDGDLVCDRCGDTVAESAGDAPPEEA